MEKRTWDYISALLIIINGIICIFCRDQIYKWIPFICAIVLLLKGIVEAVEGIKEKDYESLERKKLERSLVLIAVAISMLVQKDNALVIAIIFWGISGLNKVANYLNESLYYFSKRQGGWIPLIKAIVEFTLSILLIYDPTGKAAEHILILGLELVIEGIFELIGAHNGDEEAIEQI